MRVLFILKKNETYGFKTTTKKSSGLWNSTRFVVDALNAKKITAKLVEVQDNNSIDKEVVAYRPDIVIIEALWVVPSKFSVLRKLHPKIKWFVHLHSNIPFLAMEGIAMEWIIKYAAEDVTTIANSEECFDALSILLRDEDLLFLPNIFGEKPMNKIRSRNDTLNVGCFGAIRPMKNHLIQAIASIKCAKDRKQKLSFHVNASRVETGGDPVLKNLRALFDATPRAELIEHPWMEQGEFLYLLNKQIDIGIQVSLTETFNVVTANYVAAGLPVVVSKEIKWVDDSCVAADDDAMEIARKMHRSLENKRLISTNQIALKKYSKKSEAMWLKFVKNSECDCEE